MKTKNSTKLKPTQKPSNKKFAKAMRDHLAEKEGISREWMKKHLVILGGV